MRSIRTLLLAGSLLSSAAFAGTDKLIIAPAPPAWVKPQPLPAIPDKPDEAAIRVLLADQQTRLEPGKIVSYMDVALQIQTPQGLAAGNLSLPWNPQTDELTVHKLVIHREGKQIDILAGGQTFTVVRREPNLESAMLDGVLTANIQPEGLQVGDVLEYAATMSKSDPVLGGHVEESGANWNGAPFTRTHLSVEWPAGLTVNLRQNGPLPPVKAVKAGNVMRAELALDHVQPVIPPRQAPARYAIGRSIEFSDFKSWADLGALMAPLYHKAAAIPVEGPLRAELEKIKAASTDPVKRTEAALALVQDRVRYVALLMGAGGLTPATAEETWARRYGDCKAKTALLLALLQELGVEADPVAANIFLGDGIDQRLPMVGLFNHVLVRAKINGRDYWLDGTRSGDTSLARLRTPDFGWGLPLVAKDAALVRMVPEALAEPDYDLAIDIDARNGLTLPAPVKAQVTLRGDQAIATRLALANLDAAARDNALRDYFKQRLDDVEIAKVSASFDRATGAESLIMEGTAKMDWDDGQYWTDWTRVGYQADFSRTGSANPEAPFAIDYPSFDRTIESIQLPPGFTAQNIFRPGPIAETVGGVEYRRTSSLKDNVFRIERIMRAVAPEFAAKDAPAAQKRLKELFDLPVSIRKPASYRSTAAETNKLLTEKPTTGEGLRAQGWAFQERGQFAEAWNAFNEALKIDPSDWAAMFGRINSAELDPKKGVMVAAREIEPLDPRQENNPMVSYVRGQAKALQGAFADALVYLDKAIAASPKPNENFYGTRANVKLALGKPAEALADADKAVEISPKSPYVLSMRAQVNRQLNRYDAALADTAALLQLKPANLSPLFKPIEINAHLLRANIFRAQGKRAEALAEADALVAAGPDDGYAHVVAARIFDASGAREKAMAAVNHAIAIKPEAYIYLNRSEIRDKSALAEREADIDAALRLEPAMPEAVAAKAQFLQDKKDFAGAIALYSKALAGRPNDGLFLSQRGIAYARSGDPTHSDQDFAAARLKAVDAGGLNNLCYEKAKAGVALAAALAECDAALSKEPGAAAIIDSRAFVLLRLGRFDEAIAAYDEALAKVPELSPSLFGRAVAWSRKGEQAKAQSDRDAALKIDPNVQKQFEGYGVTMQAVTPKT